ncbi:TPA: hypothetical protein I7768_19695 [Vibrio vulnificus]|nr:hypothetical protein [Vibrio vulnificus]HAS8218858.1 hypothetical protein [Vibrio vulnificus]HAS8299554.1 hypothetical protein [Vibrio vulnificus]HAS8479209.1 hypothetical protein [Vibrio vulnificus]
MENKKFFALTIVLYVSSLISYYIQIKIIDMYGLHVKYNFDLYISYLQIAITLAIFGLPNAISLMVSRERRVPNNIYKYCLVMAFFSTVILGVFFVENHYLILWILFAYIYISLFNDLNTGVMSSIGMFEYPRIWQLIGNALLLAFIYIGPFDAFIDVDIDASYYALTFIIIPIIPLFLFVYFSRGYKDKLSYYQGVSLKEVFKYVNYIYIFSIMSIIMVRLPYINFSNFLDKHSLAQYTLSVSLSNFIVIPLNLMTLKVLSSEMKKDVKILLINFCLFLLIVTIALIIYLFSDLFPYVLNVVNIHSPEILISTFFFVSLMAVSSVNLSIALRIQKKLKEFVLLDAILILVIFAITLNLIVTLENLSEYNYLISCVVLLKIILQVYILRGGNVYNRNC